MKSPTVIQKGAYFQNMFFEREQNIHQSKLEEIKKNPSNQLVKSTIESMKNLQDISKKYHRNHRVFQAREEYFQASIKKAPALKRKSLFKNHETSCSSARNSQSPTGRSSSTKSQRSVMNLQKKNEEMRIESQNFILAKQIFELPSLYSKQEQLTSYKRHRQLSENIQRYRITYERQQHLQKDHQLRKTRNQTQQNFFQRKQTEGTLILENYQIQISLAIQEIQIFNLPIMNWESEVYYLEIVTPGGQIIQTNPDLWDNFNKLSVNLSISEQEINQAEDQKIYFKIIQILLSSQNQQERFLGDFYYDVSNASKQDGTRDQTFEIRNFYEERKFPSYVPKDKRKQGALEATLKIAIIKQTINNNLNNTNNTNTNANNKNSEFNPQIANEQADQIIKN